MSGRALAAGAIVMAAALAYGATIDNYFIQDDFGVVWLLAQKPAGYFPTWFVTSWMDNIWGFTPDEVRPFVAVTYQAAALLGPATPWPNHAINIAFHAGTALLVWGTALHAARVGLVAATVAAVVFVVLPNQAETVAWITGRVDSMPALFYVAAVLAWIRWRRTGRRGAYVWSIAWCFVALFSKQNTIILVPALALYDWLVERRPPGLAPRHWAAYVPHTVLTIAYLALRYVLFGEVARESQLTAARPGIFLNDAGDHLMRVVFGAENPSDVTFWGLAIALVLGGLGWAASRARPVSDDRWWWVRPAIYFGPVWIGLCLAPTLMSTYASPRHAYLASAGWAILAGIAFEAIWRRQTMRARVCVAAAAAIVLAIYAIQVQALVAEWDERALVARRAVVDLQREALAAAPGTLIVAGVPAGSFEFSMPFAVRPPFADADVSRRVRIIFHSSLSCCRASLWEPETRETLRAWLEDPARPPVVGLYWDPRTGRLSRVRESDDPSLRTLVRLLAATGSGPALDGSIARVIAEVVAPHPVGDR